MTSLTTQFSMGINQYPKDVLAAVNILTNHRFDKRENQETITKQQELEQHQHSINDYYSK
jgi:hypothetical protein